MQIQKDEVRDRIVDSAKQEFLENGIEKASMRKIAQDSNMTVGNLYRYFKNKEELNKFIVGDTLVEINRLVMEKSANTVSMTDSNFTIDMTVDQYRTVLDDLADEMVDIYKKHKVEFNILMMHSKLNDDITVWFTGLIKSIIRNTFGLTGYDSEIDILSHSYAVSIFSGLKDIFFNSDTGMPTLKSLVKIYLRSYINSLSADISSYIDSLE